jgi:hypothetical protein
MNKLPLYNHVATKRVIITDFLLTKQQITMKKKTIKIEQISFDKETIAHLDDAQLSNQIAGAGTMSCNAGLEELELHSCCMHTCTGTVVD